MEEAGKRRLFSRTQRQSPARITQYRISNPNSQLLSTLYLEELHV